jgi:CRP-like cAMP-binding protein
VLVRAGKPCDKVFRLASGWAYRERMLPNGRRAILDFYVPGDLIGLDHLFLERARDSVVMLTAAGYYSLDCEALRTLCQRNSGVALEVARLLSHEKQRLERHATRLARLPAWERTVAALQHLCERLAARREGDELSTSDQGALLPLVQPLLADHLGLSVVHLNRALGALRSRNVVKIENGAILIGDLQRLKGASIVDSDLI